MSFSDEIKKVQGSRIIDGDSSAYYEKKKQTDAKAIADEIKTALINAAKRVPADTVFSYDGFVFCFSYSMYEKYKISKRDVFCIQAISELSERRITLSRYGAELLSLVNEFLNPDGIIIESFCCRGEHDDECVELPIKVKYVYRPYKTNKWTMTGKNKTVKVELKYNAYIEDLIYYGAHCVYKQI